MRTHPSGRGHGNAAALRTLDELGRTSLDDQRMVAAFLLSSRQLQHVHADAAEFAWDSPRENRNNAQWRARRESAICIPEK